MEVWKAGVGRKTGHLTGSARLAGAREEQGGPAGLRDRSPPASRGTRSDAGDRNRIADGVRIRVRIRDRDRVRVRDRDRNRAGTSTDKEAGSGAETGTATVAETDSPFPPYRFSVSPPRPPR